MKTFKSIIFFSILMVGVACAVAATAMAPEAGAIVMVAGITILPAMIAGPNGQEVPPFTRAQKKMYDFLRMKGNAITLEALQSGALKWDNISYYIRSIITGLSGRKTILNASTSQVVGVCNLDKGQLPQYYNFAYDRVEVAEAINNTSASLAVTALTSFSSVQSSMDAGLRNGELIVMSNRQVQVETPITDFTSKTAVSGGGAKEYDGGALDDPQVWEELLQIQVDLNFAQTIASEANTTYAVDVTFRGVQARLR